MELNINEFDGCRVYAENQVREVRNIETCPTQL